MEKLVPTIHTTSVDALLSEFPSASAIVSAYLTRLTNRLQTISKDHYSKDTAIVFREAAKTSIGSHVPAKSLELKHTIKLMQELPLGKILGYAGMQPLRHTLKRSVLKVNTIMLFLPMLQRNLYGLFTGLKNWSAILQGNLIFKNQ